MARYWCTSDVTIELFLKKRTLFVNSLRKCEDQTCISIASPEPVAKSPRSQNEHHSLNKPNFGDVLKCQGQIVVRSQRSTAHPPLAAVSRQWKCHNPMEGSSFSRRRAPSTAHKVVLAFSSPDGRRRRRASVPTRDLPPIVTPCDLHRLEVWFEYLSNRRVEFFRRPIRSLEPFLSASVVVQSHRGLGCDPGSSRGSMLAHGARRWVFANQQKRHDPPRRRGSRGSTVFLLAAICVFVSLNNDRSPSVRPQS